MENELRLVIVWLPKGGAEEQAIALRLDREFLKEGNPRKEEYLDAMRVVLRNTAKVRLERFPEDGTQIGKLKVIYEDNGEQTHIWAADTEMSINILALAFEAVLDKVVISCCGKCASGLECESTQPDNRV